MVYVLLQRQKKTNVSAQACSAERIQPSPHFGSSWALNRLDEAHLLRGGQFNWSANSVLIYSEHVILDTPEIMFNQVSGHPEAQSG